MTLWTEITELIGDLRRLLEETKTLGRELARKEAHYYSVKAHTVERLKSEGMSAAMISLVIKGDPQVNQALYEFHEAQIAYDNAKEGINVYKKSLGILNEQYAREWNSGGYIEY